MTVGQKDFWGSQRRQTVDAIYDSFRSPGSGWQRKRREAQSFKLPNGAVEQLPG